ncbi:glycosyl hydrolase family 18 protein [Ralstonia solanacearum]|uniref:glycosyl hydrolase family 18 protein n=1 Tax=Ralstonia solanacearum TaxID=305 RepID=UPI0006DC86D5|nr:glycosyl hydrolase family 18 protein [Ralstonia solanacearum]
MSFEIATWYDTWNSTGLDNLAQRKVPLGYASRYNLAFGEFVPCANGYTVDLNAKFASQVLTQIRTQAPGVLIYAGVGDTGLSATVLDNRQHNNRSTANIVAYLRQQGLNGIDIDAEQDGMTYVPELLAQLGPAFKKAGLGIAVSVPWPGNGPVGLYGDNAVAAFNQHVDAVELQDYSSEGTPADVQVWIDAGVRRAILMGGVCTENGNVQTSLEDTAAWTTFALQNQLRGMFSWRLDNDHGQHGTQEDVDPTFTGAQTVYETVQNYGSGAGRSSGVLDVAGST